MLRVTTRAGRNFIIDYSLEDFWSRVEAAQEMEGSITYIFYKMDGERVVIPKDSLDSIESLTDDYMLPKLSPPPPRMSH